MFRNVPEFLFRFLRDRTEILLDFSRKTMVNGSGNLFGESPPHEIA
jgi:hypothetical protein